MVTRQITLRPQDIVALLKIVSFYRQGQVSWKKGDLAAALFLANSEITNVFGRLRHTGLIDTSNNAIQYHSFYEFLLYGLKHSFPALVGQETKGVITGINALPDSGIKAPSYVWPDYLGKHRGYSVIPLYPEAPAAARDDDYLHQLLAACDVLRIGKVREVNFARTWLKKQLLAKG
jgi:hypothetical protein